jgi:hypothetical protein
VANSTANLVKEIKGEWYITYLIRCFLTPWYYGLLLLSIRRTIVPYSAPY